MEGGEIWAEHGDVGSVEKGDDLGRGLREIVWAEEGGRWFGQRI